MSLASGQPVNIAQSPPTPKVFSSTADTTSTATKADGPPATYFHIYVDASSSYPVAVTVGWTDGTTSTDYCAVGFSAQFVGKTDGGRGKIAWVELRGSGGGAVGVVWAVRGK